MSRVETLPLAERRSRFPLLVAGVAAIALANALLRAHGIDARTLDFQGRALTDELGTLLQLAPELSLAKRLALAQAACSVTSLLILAWTARQRAMKGVVFVALAIAALQEPIGALPYVAWLGGIVAVTRGERASVVGFVLGALSLAAPSAVEIQLTGFLLLAALPLRRRALPLFVGAGVALLALVALGLTPWIRAPWEGSSESSGSIAAFVVLALLVLPVSPRGRRSALLLAAPAAIAAVFGESVERLVPLIGVLALTVPEDADSHPVRAAHAFVLSALWLAVLAGHRQGHPAAWSPARLLRIGEAEPQQPPWQSDLGRATRFAAQYPSCVGVSEDLALVHALSGRPGPSAALLPWREVDLGAAVRRWKCPHFIASRFGPEAIAVAELYQPTERLGPSMFVLTLRPTPIELSRHDLVSGPLSGTVELGRRLSAADVVVLDYSGRGSVQFFSGDEPVGEPTRLESRDHRAVLPVDPEVAKWRWLGGRASEGPSANRMVLRGVTLRSMTSVEPPPVSAPATSTCRQGARLADARSTRIDAHGESVLLTPNTASEPRAELFFETTPCAESCVFAQIGAEDGTVLLEGNVVDGPKRTLIAHRELHVGAPTILETPLGDWANRDVLIQLDARPLGRAPPGRAEIIDLRVAPCTSFVSLMHVVANGGHQVMRGEAEPSGDQLRLGTHPTGAAPVEVRIPFLAPVDSCVALDVSVEGPAGAKASVDVGVLEGRRYVRFFRDTMSAGAPVEEHRDLPLQRWERRAVALRVTTQRLEGASAKVIIARPRVHRCGDGAPWGF